MSRSAGSLCQALPGEDLRLATQLTDWRRPPVLWRRRVIVIGNQPLLEAEGREGGFSAAGPLCGLLIAWECTDQRTQGCDAYNLKIS